MTPLSDQGRPGLSPLNRAQLASAPPERIGQLAQAFVEGAASVLTAKMSRQITLAVLGIDNVTPTDLLRRVPLPWVLSELRYAEGPSGGHWLILGRSGALVLGHALSGGQEGEALELLPARQNAVRDAIGEIVTAASPVLASILGRPIAFAPIGLQMVEDPATLPPGLSGELEELWLIRAVATGPDGFRADFSLTVGSELAAEMASAGASPMGVGAAAESGVSESQPSGMSLILDVTLPVAVELGRARMQIQDILKLAPGSIVELDKSAGDPVELLINDRPIAKGEVVVIDENFGIRLTSIVTASERLKTLR